MKQIAFIGFGHMDAPMATSLPKAGYLLNVFDLVQSAADGLVAVGASAARSARDAVQGVGTVISMLPVSQHVEGLYFNDDGLLAHIAPGTLVLECSTIVSTPVRKVHAAARECGLAILDAPMSGGIVGAAAGTPIFMTGGNAEALEKARPLFEVIGQNIFHADPNGAGQVAKVYNSQSLAVLVIGTVEAMVLGVTNDLEAKVLAEIICRSSGDNWVLEVYNLWPGTMENAPVPRDYSGGFMAQLMAEDLGLVQEVAQVSVSSTPMGSLALSLYRLLLKQSYVERDSSAVQKLFDST